VLDAPRCILSLAHGFGYDAFEGCTAGQQQLGSVMHETGRSADKVRPGGVRAGENLVEHWLADRSPQDVLPG